LLTADLVHVARRGDRLVVVPIAARDRPRALELATYYLGLARAHIGETRGDLLEACQGIQLAAHEVRLAKGLFKLVLDQCLFEESSSVDAHALRADLFSHATALRRQHHTASAFNRTDLITAQAQKLNLTPAVLEQSLYSDLPEAHRLQQANLPSADGLLASYELAQHQAVLLRAVNMVAEVFTSAPIHMRDLFRQLKFHRLLYAITPRKRGKGYEITLDGPMSLFEQTTKYGLKLALALPSLMTADTWSIKANLRWGHDRRPLEYRHRGHGTPQTATLALPDEIARLHSELTQMNSSWQIHIAEQLFDCPSLGVLVPDLEFIHRPTGKRVYLEVLGFWNRDAVWKRIAMAAQGLPYPTFFAVSKHLRVSEEAMPSESTASLYVYSRHLHPKTILERVATLAGE
jgi:predicted nuclease of restriction endonuclease-like RecB superfamily